MNAPAPHRDSHFDDAYDSTTQTDVAYATTPQTDAYGSTPQTDDAHTTQNRQAHQLEREIQLQEYENDRDAILHNIKMALRERRYRDAQAFIYTYRAAAKTDECFAALAQMTSKGLDEERQIETLVTILEATPEDDIDKRIEICEKILSVQPHHPKYRAELKALKSSHTEDFIPAATNAAIPKRPLMSSPCGVVFGLITLVNAGLCLAWVHSLLSTLIIVSLTFVQYGLLSNHPYSPLQKAPDSIKILVNFWIWWLYIYLLMNIL